MLHFAYPVRTIVVALLCFCYTVSGAQFEVVVGGPGVLQFNPPTVAASPGDSVIFIFMQSNHTATQSTFESPCKAAPDGFDSGFVPVAEDDNGPFPAALFNVTDTNPVWVYCRQANHCQQGMVFAINPGNKFATFKAAAMGETASTSTSVPSNSASTSTLPSPSGSSVEFSSIPPQPTPTGLPTPTTTSSDHLVVVGGPNKFFFSPSNITAEVGDTVTFQFQQKNHTVTQSTFAEPCISLTKTSTSGQTGFDSGFMPVADNATFFPTFTIQVNDTSPIWAYCRQVNHCGSGMVFSVNAIESGSNNFEAFQTRAKQLNGTGSNSTDSSSASSNGAMSFGINHCAGFAVTFFSLFLRLLI